MADSKWSREFPQVDSTASLDAYYFVRRIDRNDVVIMGEVRTFSGRIRLAKGDRRVTVGPRTTCFYRMDGRQAVEFDNVKTKDDDAIFARS